MSLVNTRGTSKKAVFADPVEWLAHTYTDETDVEDKVAAVIQVGGMNTLVRPDPTNDQRRAWFREVSLVLSIIVVWKHR